MTNIFEDNNYFSMILHSAAMGNLHQQVPYLDVVQHTHIFFRNCHSKTLNTLLPYFT